MFPEFISFGENTAIVLPIIVNIEPNPMKPIFLLLCP
jgi:hypothetical protein